MNMNEWQSRFTRLKVREEQTEKQLDEIRADIADCFVNIEGIRKRDIMARRGKQYSRQNNKRKL